MLATLIIPSLSTSKEIHGHLLQNWFLVFPECWHYKRYSINISMAVIAIIIIIMPSNWTISNSAGDPKQGRLRGIGRPQVGSLGNEVINASEKDHHEHLFLMRVCKLSHFSRVWLCDPWTAARQAPLSMGISRQKYWSGLPFSPPGDLPDPGTEPSSHVAPASQADSLLLSHRGSPLFLIGNGRLECCLGVWKRSQSLISLSIGSDDYSFRHIVNLRKGAFWGFLVKVVVGGGRVWSYKAPLHFPYFFITYLRVCYVSRFTCQFLPQLSMITIWKYLITGFKRIIFKFKMFIWKVVMQLNWTEWPTLAAHRKKKRHSQRRY